MSNVLKKISTDAFLYSVLPQLPKIINFVLLPITSQYLSALDFAVFGTVMAFIMGFDILKSAGLDIVLMNSFFKDPDHYSTTWKKVQGFISIWSLVLTVIVACVVYFILPNELSTKDKWFIVLSTSLPSFLFAGLSKISVLFYQYSQHPTPIVLRSFFMGLLAVLLNLYFIVELKLGYKSWFYTGLVTGIILPLTYIHPIWIVKKLTPSYRISRQELIGMLKVSLPIIPHHYASYFLNYSDRVLLSLFHVPSPQLGLYNLGCSVSGNFRLFSNAIDKVLGPLFHKRLASEDSTEFIKNSVFLLAALYLFIGFLGGIWMKELFGLLIRNPELSAAYPVAIIILYSFTTRPLYNGAQSFLFFEERVSRIWRVTFMFGMLNIALNVIFIPFFGINAAAVNTLICIAGSNYGVFLLKDYRLASKVNFYPIRWLTVTAVVFGASWFLKDASIFSKSFATLTAILIASGYLYFMRKHSNRETSLLYS